MIAARVDQLPGGVDETLAQVVAVEEEIAELDAEVADLGGLLYRNKIGFAAAILAVLLILYTLYAILF